MKSDWNNPNVPFMHEAVGRKEEPTIEDRMPSPLRGPRQEHLERHLLRRWGAHRCRRHGACVGSVVSWRDYVPTLSEVLIALGTLIIVSAALYRMVTRSL